jgi:hypothetical protein
MWITLAAGCAYSVWFVFSVLGQLDAISQKLGRRLRWVRTWDYLGLVPKWTFFAPRPATGDVALLYRDRLANGAITPWTEVLRPSSRELWNVLWNPDKRERKALIDWKRGLWARARRLRNVQHAKGGGARRVDATAFGTNCFHYLAILAHVSSLPRPSAAVAVQFCLSIRESVWQQGEVIIVSGYHLLPDPQIELSSGAQTFETRIST